MTAAQTQSRHNPRTPLEAGLAYHRAGDIAKAETNYRRALAAQPGDPVVLHLLGLAVFDRGRPERALQLIEKALRQAPTNPDFLHSAGHVLQAMGRYNEAVARYCAALEADPNRAITRSNLGNTLKRAGHLDEAATELAKAVELAPGFAEGWSNLGLVETERGRFGEAVACFERAAALGPENPEFPYNLGNSLMTANEVAKASDAYRRAIALAPTHVHAHVGLGAALRQSGELRESQRVLDRALTLAPDDAEARWNLALAELMAGAWKSGFANFEARLALPDYKLPAARVPRWDGRPIPGRTLLVAHEQGMGDAIQFMRFAADAARLGARVVCRGPKTLLPLISRVNGVAATAALDAPLPTCDLWVPMMSLPNVLRCVSTQRLSRGGYLAPDSARMARWRQRLAEIGGCRIGICWQGNPAYRGDAERSFVLSHYTSLARLPGVTLISLQKGSGTEQCADWPEDLPLVDLGPELDGERGAFMDTAAVLPWLDLVVTSDTALAHLAGAVGVPAYLALAKVPDWRWGLEGDRTVWYPTVHVFRQRRPGDWSGVFADMAEALGARIGVHG